MIDVLDRIAYYTNEMMWKQCEILKSVVTMTVETKLGRGNNVIITKELKHNTPKEVIDKIVRSCEYYKKLYEMESKKVGSLEVVKYRFDTINEEPKIIIEMIKVLDTDGKYIKFAKLKNVVDYLSKYPIKFKSYD